jgi:putative CocE/NonD family hydrolase
VTASDFGQAVVFPGGAFALETSVAWLYQLQYQELGWRGVVRAQLAGARKLRTACEVLPIGTCDVAAVGDPVGFYREWLDHSAPADAWWGRVDFGRRLDEVPPASLIGGWYDLFLPAQIADYEALRAAGRTARLTVGPWTHTSAGLQAETIRDGLDWFGVQLGERRGKAHRAPVRVYVMGSRTWQEFSSWPPASEARTWYLGRWGTLGPDPPAESAPDRFHYNPHDPTPAVGGPSLNLRSSGRKEQREREHRHDVVTYTSPVLTEDLTVIGPLSATLYLRSTLEHTDFFVRLCDVTEKGRSYNLSDGIVRLRPESAFVQKESDGVFKLEIAMWPTANTFKAGHRIRFQVSSGAHPLFSRNTGTGEPLATGANLHSADQEVYHDAVRSSCITLPVVRLLRDEQAG